MASTPFDETFDVVVVGSGAAGCSAAIAAFLHGAGHILICEKDEAMTGGTTRMAGGGWVWFPRNPFLRELGVAEPVEDIIRLMTTWAQTSNADSASEVDSQDLNLIRAFAEESEGVIDALVSNGFYNCDPTEVKNEEDRLKNAALLRKKLSADPAAAARAGLRESVIETLAQYIPSYCAESDLDSIPTGKVLRNTIGGGTAQQLVKAARGLTGCELRKGAAVVDLVRDLTGVAIGVKLRLAADGQEVAVRALGGVVFASGGYSHDQDLLDQHMGQGVVWGSCAASGCTGDLMRIARAHGIPVPRPGRAWMKQTVLPHSPDRFGGVFFLNVDSAFVVDASGRRFANEKHHYQDRAMDMVHNAAERRLVFFIFDERARRRYAGPIMGQGGPIPTAEAEEDCLISGADAAILGDNLASFTNRLDPAFAFDAQVFASGLVETLAKFDRYARSGVDEDFARGETAGDNGWHLVGRAKDNSFPNKTMFPLEWGNGKGDLHCLVLGVSTLDTKGGPRIDAKARILGSDGAPIVGLYGAGNCVRSASNNSYWSAGCTISHAMVFGFIAGRDAASRVQKSQASKL